MAKTPDPERLELLQGTLDMLILRTLQWGAQHGHGIGQAISSQSDELPREQRDVFIAHEIDGVSFKELSAKTGVSVNTLLSRKRYAVMHLRRRLQGVYDDLTNG